MGDPVAALINRVASDAFDQYPTDSSCFTCDYYFDGVCANNEHAEIPKAFAEEGCDAWKDEGAPF